MTPPRPVATIRCAWCGRGFQTRRPTGYGLRRYCSTAHRVAAYRRAHGRPQDHQVAALASYLRHD